MGKKRIVTISRTYGSGGREVGEKLARELGISFYDKNLLLEMSERTGISPEGLKNADEKLLDRLADPYAAGIRQQYGTNLYLYRIEKKLIEEIAERESCVIVGRLADWILKDRPDVLKVFITAPEEDRISRIMEKEEVTREQAQKLIKEVDRMRKKYYAFFTDDKWKSTENRDIVINSSFQGIDGAVEILKYILEMA